MGLSEPPGTLVSNIGVGKQQLVEIAKALSKDVKLLILDEPTASLNEKKVTPCSIYCSSSNAMALPPF